MFQCWSGQWREGRIVWTDPADRQLGGINRRTGEGVTQLPPDPHSAQLSSIMAPRTKLVAIHPIHGYAIKPPQDLKTIKRNERERNRVETVNRGFEVLRRHVPTAAMVKKMSKVNILNQAVDYIEYLKQILERGGTEYQQPQQQSSPWQLQHYQHQQQPHQHLHQHHQHQHQQPQFSPFSPQQTITSPGTFSDNSSQGYFSDQNTSLQSHHLSPYSTSLYNVKQELPEAPDSTTDSLETSGEEDDVLDAIAEWQQM